MARVCVVMVTQSKPDPKTVSDLIAVARQSDCAISIAVGGSLQDKRYAMGVQALKAGATDVVYLDGDQRFPADTITRLLKSKQQIVGANYLWRHAPVWCATRNGERISSVGRIGLEAVDDLGMGCVLIKSDVFKAVSVPWFDMPWDDAQKCYTSEHAYFFGKAKAAGFSAYVDHDLSQLVRHGGEVEYGVKGATYSTSDIIVPWKVEAE